MCGVNGSKQLASQLLCYLLSALVLLPARGPAGCSRSPSTRSTQPQLPSVTLARCSFATASSAVISLACASASFFSCPIAARTLSTFFCAIVDWWVEGGVGCVCVDGVWTVGGM